MSCCSQPRQKWRAYNLCIQIASLIQIIYIFFYSVFTEAREQVYKSSSADEKLKIALESLTMPVTKTLEILQENGFSFNILHFFMKIAVTSLTY